MNEASLAKALATPGARDALLYISESARPVERIGIVLVFSTIRWDLPRAFDSSDLVGLPVT